MVKVPCTSIMVPLQLLVFHVVLPSPDVANVDPPSKVSVLVLAVLMFNVAVVSTVNILL